MNATHLQSIGSAVLLHGCTIHTERKIRHALTYKEVKGQIVWFTEEHAAGKSEQ